MNKTEMLNIINEPSKHIHIVKIDGKDSIVYSSKFIELLELIPTMLTKDDMVAMLTELQLEIEESENCGRAFHLGLQMASKTIQKKINKLKENKDGTNTD